MLSRTEFINLFSSADEATQIKVRAILESNSIKPLNELVGFQTIRIAADHSTEIRAVMEERGGEEKDPIWMAFCVFTAGYLAGIRAERRSRKTHEKPWKLKGV